MWEGSTSGVTKVLRPPMENSTVIPTGAPQGLDFFMVLTPGEQRAIAVLGVLAGAVGLLENGLVLGLIACGPALRRRPSFLFMGSLALADLLASAFYSVSFVDFHLFGRRDGRAASLLKLGGVTLAFGGSVGSLLLTALDRFLCLHRSHSYRALLTPRRALLALLLLWSATLLVSFLPLMGWRCSTGLRPPCSQLFPYVSHSFQLCWTAGVVLELLVILAAYAVILWKARLHTAAMAALRAAAAAAAAAAGPQRARVRLDLRLARTLSLVLLVLVGCWLPVLGFMLADVATALSPAHRRAFAFCSLLCLVNSAVNPLLYALRCQDIRQALVVRLRCLTGGGACCRRRRRRRAGTPTPRESGPTQPEVSGTGISSYCLATPWGSQREVGKGGQQGVGRGGQQGVGRGGQQGVGKGGQQEVGKGGQQGVGRGGGAGGGDGEGV
ncbi:unnamed protein product [Boreogadus saida]